MRYGSVCSGIEAATVAWHPLGWQCAFASEIEAFPRAVLQYRWPEIPLHGDFTTIEAGEYDPIDLLVGGTPCQSFSIAGLRGGLDDDRGNLALEYLRLADRLRPRWLVWENVPGVLSSSGGRDFGSILGGMGELGYGVAYRVLDAQFFRLAQRRRRVFVIGYLGDWRRAAAVLFERNGLSGNPAPSREAGKGTTLRTAPCPRARSNASHRLDSEAYVADVAPTMRAGGNQTGGDRPYGTDVDTCDSLVVAHTLKGEGFDASEDGTGRGTPIIPVAFSIMPMNSGKDYKAREVGITQPVMAGGNPASAQGGDVIVQPIAFDTTQITSAANRSNPKAGDACHPLAAGAHPPAIAGSAVRRLTPRECERLQGFPDDYTLIPWRKGMAPDGPRYKALGNSMAVPVMAWLGRRIEAVEALSLEAA